MNNLFTLSKPAIEYLCKCINLTASVSEAIDDLNLRSDGVMSSVKVDKLIKQCLQDANGYSDQVVSALTHLVAEKIDFEPTLDNTADKLNTLLLYSKNSDNNYTQYLRLTNELLNLGDTSLSLNEYLKISDADKFVLKTSYDDLVTKVNEIDNTIGSETLTTTSQTITGAINNLVTSVENKVDKDNIATVLDDTVTDEQMPSAKAVYNTTVDKNIKTYCLFSQLGLSSGCSVGDIFNAMPIGSIGRFDYNGSTITDMPSINGGVLLIDKCNAYRFSIEFKESAYSSVANNNMWIGQLQGTDGTGLTWQRVCVTKVNDVAVKGITFDNDTNYKSSTSSELKYTVSNGICYVTGGIDCISPIISGVVVCTNMPKSYMMVYARGLNINGVDDDDTAKIYINGTDLQIKRGVAGNSYRFTFSYPVAE